MAASGPFELERPVRHQKRPGIALVVFGLFGAALAWTGNELVNFAVASYVCYPDRVPLGSTPLGWGWVWPFLLVMCVFALAIGIAAVSISYRIWQMTRDDDSGGHYVLEIGKDRTRFLAMCGIMIGIGFIIADILNMATLFLVPLCGQGG